MYDKNSMKVTQKKLCRKWHFWELRFSKFSRTPKQHTPFPLKIFAYWAWWKSSYGPVTKQFLIKKISNGNIYVHYEKQQRYLQLLARRHWFSEACDVATQLPLGSRPPVRVTYMYWAQWIISKLIFFFLLVNCCTLLYVKKTYPIMFVVCSKFIPRQKEDLRTILTPKKKELFSQRTTKLTDLCL